MLYILCNLVALIQVLIDKMFIEENTNKCIYIYTNTIIINGIIPKNFQIYQIIFNFDFSIQEICSLNFLSDIYPRTVNQNLQWNYLKTQNVLYLH